LDYGRIIGDGRLEQLYGIQSVREVIERIYGLHALSLHTVSVIGK
jgi:hypothetical protein